MGLPGAGKTTLANELSKLIEDRRLDVRDNIAMKDLISSIKPDFVFHLAAQPLVKKSYLDPMETYNTNMFGTLNLLEGLRILKNPCTVILITSDKCYQNVEWVWGYRETDILGGHDPYSASKGAADLVFSSYPAKKNNLSLISGPENVKAITSSSNSGKSCPS